MGPRNQRGRHQSFCSGGQGPCSKQRALNQIFELVIQSLGMRLQILTTVRTASLAQQLRGHSESWMKANSLLCLRRLTRRGREWMN